MHRARPLKLVAVLGMLLAVAGLAVLFGTTGSGDGSRADAATASAAGKRQVLVGKARKLTGGVVSLSRYRGRVVLVVNTASQCGNTPQFGGLESLYNRKRGKGFVVLGFPSGDFGDQELTDPDEIAGFGKKNYGVSFPMFAKTHVRGGDANPFFKRLIREAGEPNWNFGKYLVDRRGHVVKRFDAYTEPTDSSIVRAIDRELKR
jgi:glutathione peroxidase